MIVKMTILRLLGSSDDKEKEKIGIARPGRTGAMKFGAEGNQTQVKKKKRMRKVVMINQVQVMKNIQGPCYTITA